MEENGAGTGRWKWWAALAILVLGLIVVGISFGLYQLGGADQAPLERLRDIVIIFLGFQLLLVTIILAGIAAGLVFLILVLKDQIIPLLTELTETAQAPARHHRVHDRRGGQADHHRRRQGRQGPCHGADGQARGDRVLGGWRRA